MSARPTRCRVGWIDPATGTKWRCRLTRAHDGKCKVVVLTEGCEIPACLRIAHRGCRGLCPAHYDQAREGGTLPDAKPRRPARDWPAELRCAVDGCGYRKKDRGLCRAHYIAARDAGTLPPNPLPDAGDRVCACGSPARWGGLCVTCARQAGVRRPGAAAGRASRKATPPEWDEQITAYIAFRTLEMLSAHTLELREYHLRRLGREIGKPPFDVTLTDLATWVASHKWSPVTYSSVRAGLVGFYEWAVRVGRIGKSPAHDLPKPRFRSGKPTPVPEEGYAASLADAGPDVRMMLRLAGDLGMRRGEVCKVHRDDLALTPQGWLLTIIGKGDKERVIPVPDRLADILIHHIDTHGADGWAFPSPGGGHLTDHWVGTLCSRALPDGYTLHKLRHRALTRTYETTKDILLTAKLAGHSSVATTQQYYVEPDHTALRAAVEGISS